jgi:hypothetical protein
MPSILQASEDKLLENRDKETAMADAILADMQRITKLAAEPRLADDSVKAAIRRASTRLEITYRRARSFWYASPDTVVRASEAERLRAEEGRFLVKQRMRIEQELDLIEARARARESRGNAASVVGVDQAQMAALLPASGTRVDEPRESSGVIADRRQIMLPGVG